MTTSADMTHPLPTAGARQPFPVPDDLEGYWELDAVHAPRPVTPLSEEILVGALNDGFRAGLREVGYPYGMCFRAFHSYVYAAFLPHELAAGELLPPWNEDVSTAIVVGLRERWEHEWLPSILPGLERLRTLDYAALSDDALLDVFVELRQDLLERWKIHGVLLFTYQAASAFEEFYRDTFKPTDPLEPYLLLGGFPTRSFEGDRGLWRLSRTVRQSPVLTGIFADSTPADRVAALEACDDGRALLTDLHAHLDEFGWRMDAILELAEPTWREDLTVSLNALHGLVGLDASDDPDARLARNAARRDQLLAQARARLTHDLEQAARFEALYAPACNHVVLDEDHNVYIDQMGNAGLRFPVLELGRRLVRHGSIDEVDDVFMLQLAEIRGGLQDQDQRPVVAERRAEMARWGAIIPPLSIGEPPPADAIDSFMAGLIKTAAPPQPVPPTESVIRGTPASAGTARGQAKVARSLEEASAIKPGQVLVCEMTLPPWSVLFATIGAVVTDTGGILSHSATVAREYGIPCVVGTITGTTVIQDGTMLEVDGTLGTVRVLKA